MSIRDIPAYSGVPNQATAPKMVISSLLDGSDKNLEPLVVRTLDDFQKAQAVAGPDLRIRADLYRAGSTREHKNRVHLLQTAFVGALKFAAGLTTCLALDPSAMDYYSALIDSKFGENLTAKESRIAHSNLPVADWKGHRTFVVDGGGLTQAGSDATVAPSASALKDNLAANMTQWPGATHVVHVFGHGNGIRGMASLQPAEVGKALVEANDQSGRKADVLLLESCLMGSVEALHQLSSGAEVAVASERSLEFPIRKGESEQHLLSPEAYARVAQSGGSAREVASQFLHEARGQRFQQDTLATFDLKTVSAQLVPSLDVLGSNLQQEMSAGHAAVINDCLKKTAVVDEKEGLLDLGSFLEQLQTRQEVFQPATLDALGSARKALEGSVLEYQPGPTGQKDSLTGMSFLDPRVSFLVDGRPVEFDTRMPSGWTGMRAGLVKDLQERPPAGP